MKKRKKRSALVPVSVFGTVFAGVVPAIVACGGGTTLGSGDAGGGDSGDAQDDMQYYGVGAPCCSVAAVFDSAPPPIDAADAAPDGTDDASDARDSG